LARLAAEPRSAPRQRGLARRWLELAAAAGDAAAADALRGLGGSTPSLDALDPLDLVGLDGSRVVVAASGGPERLWTKVPVDALAERLTVGRDRGGALRELQALARGGDRFAGWVLGRAWLEARGLDIEPRRGLAWMVLAGLDGATPETRGFTPARLRVGRALLLSEGCSAWPAAGRAWLETVLERPEGSGELEAEAAHWLGLADFAGWGRAADPVGGLARLRTALRDAARVDAGTPASKLQERLRALLDEVAGRERGAHLARCALRDRHALREAARTDADARAALVALAGAEEALVEPQRFAYQYGLLLAGERRRDEARVWLTRALDLGKPGARDALDALARGESLEDFGAVPDGDE
jgi:hypothetical protein